MPTGLFIISNVLKQAGHSVKVYDINAIRFPKEQVQSFIEENVIFYDFVGISGIVTTYEYQKWLISIIRKISNIPIVCGGGCASSVSELLVKAGATSVITGPGENKLLEYLHENIRYKNIDEIPYPDWGNVPMEIYLSNPIWGQDTGNTSNTDIHPDMKQQRSMNIVTSRGCPYNCNFCYDLFGRGYQQRSVTNVIGEIRELKSRYNVDFIGFVDDNMFVNKAWVHEFCREIGKENILWGCHARVNEVNKDILATAYGAGCRWIGYGIESGAQSILARMNKRVKTEQAKAAVELTREANIYPNTSFIYGYPGECKATVDETIGFCKGLGLKPAFFYATPYPMTRLYEQYKEKIISTFHGIENFIKALGDAKDFIINLTDLPDKEFFALKNYLQKELA